MVKRVTSPETAPQLVNLPVPQASVVLSEVVGVAVAVVTKTEVVENVSSVVVKVISLEIAHLLVVPVLLRAGMAAVATGAVAAVAVVAVRPATTVVVLATWQGIATKVEA